MFSSLLDIIDQHHPLVKLAEKTPWQRFEELFLNNTVRDGQAGKADSADGITFNLETTAQS